MKKTFSMLWDSSDYRHIFQTNFFIMNKIISSLEPFGHQHEIKINKTKDETTVVKSLLLYVDLPVPL